MENKISIITPVLNGEEYIAETIESIIFQRGNFELEYIVIDGNSSDKTLDICDYYRRMVEVMVEEELLSPRTIAIYSATDSGLYEALARGLVKCSGDIIGYLNASDRYLPGAFSALVRAFNDNSVKWVTGWNTLSDENGRIHAARYPFYYNRRLIRQYFYGGVLNHIQQESTFWKSDLNSLIDFNILSGLKHAGDFYIWHEFSKYHELYVLDALLGCFRNHSGQISLDKDNYEKEVSLISIGINKWSIASCIYYLARFLPYKLKRLLNRHSIQL